MLINLQFQKKRVEIYFISRASLLFTFLVIVIKIIFSKFLLSSL